MTDDQAGITLVMVLCWIVIVTTVIVGLMSFGFMSFGGILL